MSCPRTPSDLGAYVLGALSPEERRHFEEHLDGCALCAAELAEFADIPALLDRVRPEDLQPVAVTPSPELFDRVSAAARGHSGCGPSRRRRWLLVAAAVLALLGVGHRRDRVGDQPGERHRDGVVRAGARDAGGDRAGGGDGARADRRRPPARRDVPHGRRRRPTGEWYPAGDWAVSADGDGTWRGWADVQRDDLREVVVYGEGDRELVRLEL